RSLLTVRAAISSARPSLAPCSRWLSLMCSYCRARFVPFFTPRGGIRPSCPKICSPEYFSTRRRRPQNRYRARRSPPRGGSASQARGPGGDALAQAANQRQVQRATSVPRLLRGVDHELLPQRAATFIRGGERVGPGQALTVALAHPDALEREQGPAQQRSELG